MRNIFLENHKQNTVEKLFPDPFLKTKIKLISGSIVQSFIKFVFIVCQIEGYRNILKLSCRPFPFTSYKPFLKAKRSLQLISLPHFLHDFWRKVFFLLYSINWPNFIVWFYFVRYWAICALSLFVNQAVTSYTSF